MQLPFISTATPEQKAYRDRAEMLTAEFNWLREDQSLRIQRFRDYEVEYEAVRDQQPTRFGTSDYQRRQKSSGEKERHNIPMPFTHAITQKHAYRIAGRLPDISADKLDSSGYQRYLADVKEKMLYACYSYSDAGVQFASGAHDASLLGASCYEVYFNLEDNLPYFRTISPAMVLPIFGNPDPHEFEAVYTFWMVPVATFRRQYGSELLLDGTPAANVEPTEDGKAILVAQFTDGKVRSTFAGGHLLAEREHNYGFAPYVIIPNLGPLRKVFGYGDYEFYRHLVAYYQLLRSREADVIIATANGGYQGDISGQSVAKAKQIIEDGGILPLRKDSKGLTPIPGAQMPVGAIEHSQAIRDAISDISFTPPAAWGSLGRSSSGTDRNLQLGPMNELTALKQIHWAAGVKRINTMLLKMIEQKSTGSVTFTGNHQRGWAITPFTITLNSAASDDGSALTDPKGQPILDLDGNAVSMPKTPADVIAGNHRTTVTFPHRQDKDDPQFQLAEVNKFAQAVQSLHTTLVHLGVDSPDDEIKLIEEEAERIPWLRQGLLALITAQLNASSKQGDGQGQDANSGQTTGLDALDNGAGGQSGANGFDATSRALNGSDNAGGKRTGVPGATYGGA